MTTFVQHFDTFSPFETLQTQFLRCDITKKRRYTDLPMGKDAIRGLVNRCAEMAGITKHLTPHIFRHTYATHLLEMGVSIYRLKELLGYSNIINTMVYLHIIKPVEEVSFSPVDRLFPVK